VEFLISDLEHMARFLAASAPHNGDWLLALPVSSCGHKLSDDAVRVSVSLIHADVKLPLSVHQSATKPECNGLSQFKEDTVPAREFNLIAYPPNPAN